MSEINDTKLIINISRDGDISLDNFAVGLSSLESLYNSFTKDNKQAQLLVKETREGSIEIDLITLSAASIVPLVDHISNLLQFSHYFEFIIAIFSEYSKKKLQEMAREHYLPTPTKKDIKNVYNILNFLSNNRDNLSIKTGNINNSNINFHFYLDGKKASLVKENINKMIEKESNTIVCKRQSFKWEQTNHSTAKSGNKALIKDLNEKPIRVIFEKDELKQEMTTSYGGIDWDKTTYSVDVEVHMIENEIVLYKVLKNHKKDSFPTEGKDTTTKELPYNSVG